MDFQQSVNAHYQRLPEVTSQRTLKFHAENFVSLGRFLAEQYPECFAQMTQLKEKHINEYINYMSDLGLSKVTIEGRIKTCRVFTRVMAEYGLKDAAKNVKYRAKMTEKVVPFTEQQVDLMIKKLNVHIPLELRLKTLCLLLLDTGLRLAEVEALNVKDINLRDMSVYINKGKGSKSRNVPFGFETRKSILKYMNVFNIDSSDLNAPLFQTQTGDRWNRRTIQAALTELGRVAKLDISCYVHRFRHTFAINMIKNGVSAAVLQKFLGHSTLQMVTTYLNIADSFAREAYVSYNDKLSAGSPKSSYSKINAVDFSKPCKKIKSA